MGPRRNKQRVLASLAPHFQHPFLGQPFSIAGMEPRMRVEHIMPDKSPVFGKFKPGDIIQVTVFRADDLRTFEVKLGSHIDAPYRIQRVANPGQEQKQIYESWLGEIQNHLR